MLIAIFTFMGMAPLKAQTSPFLGDWQEPTGSIIRIEACSSGFCIRILSISPKAPAASDIYNPDATLRSRSLCNLEIGSHFSLSDATHASGGTLYDPKSGNTYRGTMVVEGDTLRLRGYVMLPFFGKTEIWRVSMEVFNLVTKEYRASSHCCRSHQNDAHLHFKTFTIVLMRKPWAVSSAI